MELCKTDTENLLRLLESAANVIDKYVDQRIPRDADKARQLRVLHRKLKKKYEQKYK